MKVLIIGGTRFLGLHIVRQLVESGHEVTVVHRGKTVCDLPKGAREKLADKNDRPRLAQLFDEVRPEVVIDTILQSGDLEWMVELLSGRVEQFIHCGSTGVYTPMNRIPAIEEDPLEALPEPAIRFNEKLAQDQVLLRAYAERGFKATIIRPTNIYGAGDIPLDIWGSRNMGFFKRLQASEPISVPNDGRALVQPGHVSDIARVFTLATGKQSAIGQVYNASDYRALSLNDYLKLLMQALGSESTVVHVPVEALLRQYLPQGKIDEQGVRFLCEHMCVSIEKARGELGYEPRVRLEDGMADNLRWLKGPRSSWPARALQQCQSRWDSPKARPIGVGAPPGVTRLQTWYNVPG